MTMDAVVEMAASHAEPIGWHKEGDDRLEALLQTPSPNPVAATASGRSQPEADMD